MYICYMGRVENVLSAEKLRDMLGLKGGFGKAVARLIMKTLEIDKANATQAKFPNDNSPDFSKHVMEELGISYVLPADQLERIPKEGGFITVSNHHFGSIDGLILCDTVGRLRSDYKLMTTLLLALVPNLRDGFLPVDNLSGKMDARSVNSIRTALNHMSSGGGIGFFPAGEVATYQKGKARTAVSEKPVIEDKPWADNIIKLIKKSGLPVIPIYFEGTNSANFHFLGKIHRRLRTVRLVHELFNKRGTVVQVRIGQPILPAETADMDLATFGKYIRNRTYALEALCHENEPAAASKPAQPVAAQEDPALVREEFARIQDRALFESGDYRCYLSPSADIPHSMREIARLREITFRAVGEGTGTPLDTDKYDTYYKHLILWNIPNQEIVGAYRIGVGRELMARPEGPQAFYTSTLFKFQSGLLPYLDKSMELGRTFIAPAYQKEVTPLKLLLSGLLTASVRMGGIQYTLGPASISNEMPHFYKSLIVHFIRQHYMMDGASQMAKATHEFKPDFLRVNPDHLLAGCSTIDDLDRLIMSISDGQYRIPVLLRKYISFGSHILDFNVDPDFKDCLDAFIFFNIKDIPENSFKSFSKFLTPEEISTYSPTV